MIIFSTGYSVDVILLNIDPIFRLKLESAQYHNACAAMPFWHNGSRWNFGICDISWLWLKR
jgi:hypothetical protein